MRLITTIVLITALSVAAHADLTTWSARVLSNKDQPEWKRVMALDAAAGKYTHFQALTTRYSDRDDLDPGTGGGPVGCTWMDPDGSRHRSVKLRYGQVAADLRYWPTGTVLYAAEPFDHTWVVTDCGPGVRGRSRIDVYCPTISEWTNYSENVRGRVDVYVLGRISRAELLSSYIGNPSR